MLHSKSNIPAHLVNVRKELCNALRLETSDLPFAGELVQVKSEDLHWQPALEKLLHGFSLRLLVPDKHYKKVTRYINQTNIGARLVYYHVKDAIQILPEDHTVFISWTFTPIILYPGGCSNR
ncbi:hypothetical protein [Niabella hibiscisoli]|uniref:hypothetical protein n=1 Tax=Niabella hibiscisoli TaxID=1825928 RepID=UPI001F0EB30C|nr:hypothetical protein [Niabella hibiscisoli]MCH5719920.1 hypothetical protein [Niabella hibiscisoli]